MTRAFIDSSLFQSNNVNNVNEDICYVWTIVENPIVIQTCFASNTVLTIESVTDLHITNAPTCVTTTLTASSTLNPVSPSNPVAATSE